MKNSYSKSKKNFLALLLSVLMVTSCAAVSACGKSNNTTDSSSSSTEEDTSTSVNDTGLVKNANFKTADTKDGLNPIITSVTGWSRSVDSEAGYTAHTSQSQSGILDTSETAWKDLIRSNANVEVSVAEAKAQWKNWSVGDKLAYYEYWKEQNPSLKSKIATELKDFYQAFNIDGEDIPSINPGTHYAADEKEDDADPDTNVLMIHNQNPAISSTSTTKTLGSAQKFTSSSTVTVPAGAAAEFSVWVKTAELQSSSTSGETQDAIAKGAYIRVTHSVGGKSLDAFEVKNINTENLNPNNENNGWVQYSFYLTASSYTDTTFTLVLGLGQGTKEERSEQVNGYAFFDDIECEIVSLKDSYDAAATVEFTTAKEDKIFNADAAEWKDARSFALDFHGGIDNTTKTDILDNIDASKITATTGKYKGEDGYTSVEGDSKVLPTLNNGGFDSTNDLKEVFTLSQIKSSTNKYLSQVYTDYLANEDGKAWLKDDQKMLVLLSAQGVAYTAKDALTFDFLKDDNTYADYMLVSFFVKTSDINGFTGAGITLDDNGTKTSFTSIDTTTLAPVKVGDDEDYFDGWQQVFFFVENQYAEDAAGNKSGSFTLTFNLGLTDITGATEDSFYPSFAAFTGFNVYHMSEEEYTAAKTSTYAKKVTVTGKDADEETGNAGFDSASEIPTNSKTTLETGFANLQNYSGVYSDSYYVNQPNGEEINLDKTKTNTYANAGLLNRDYFVGTEEHESYFDPSVDGSISALLASQTTETTAENVWNTVIGNDVSQPLVIWNDKNMQNAYGFIGKSKSVAANSYAVVSVRVKAVNASAYVYLIDMDDTTYSSTLSIGSNLVYWYDKDGNICTGDPAENSTQKAFLLQSNGLYKANDKWTGYNSLTEKTLPYANLEAYEEVNGNLVVAKGGAAHSYSEKDADGNVIAFYGDGNGNYYADKAKTVKVLNLADVTKASENDESKPLPYRYLANANKQLMATVGNSVTTEDPLGKWVTVTFYIHTGDLAKNYRLEVWSGSRELGDNAVVNNSTDTKASYVMFDMNNPGSADSNFSALIEEKKDVAGATSFESIFSYNDSASFLAYDKSLDSEKVGNLYEDTTARTAGVAYLAFTENGSQTVFADYQYSEIKITAKAVVDEEEDTKPEEDTHDHENETNAAMLFSSIAIALVLVFAIASIIARKAIKSYRKKHGVKAKAPKAKKEKAVKAKKASEEQQDEDSPYND